MLRLAFVLVCSFLFSCSTDNPQPLAPLPAGKAADLIGILGTFEPAPESEPDATGETAPDSTQVEADSVAVDTPRIVNPWLSSFGVEIVNFTEHEKYLGEDVFEITYSYTVANLGKADLKEVRVMVTKYKDGGHAGGNGNLFMSLRAGESEKLEDKSFYLNHIGFRYPWRDTWDCYDITLSAWRETEDDDWEEVTDTLAGTCGE